jgi:hypothetical protein
MPPWAESRWLMLGAILSVSLVWYIYSGWRGGGGDGGGGTGGARPSADDMRRARLRNLR